MKRKPLLTLFFLILMLLTSNVCYAYVYKNPDYYVGIVVHPTHVEIPSFSRSLVDSLGVIDLVQLPIRIMGNTTSHVDFGLSELEKWLNAFKGYDISLQTYYSDFGFYTWERGSFEQFNLTTLSQEFYSNYFSKLTNLIKNYPNVILYIGFNEPYLHFLEDEVPILVEREYTTWKNYTTTIPFATEFFMPIEYWKDRITFLTDRPTWSLLKEIWIKFSDYVSGNFWLPESEPLPSPPYIPEEFSIEKVRKLAYDTWEIIKMYSEEIGKPIFIAELPCQYPDIFAKIVKEAMVKPNIAQHYCLMLVNPYHDDVLFGINPITMEYWKIQPTCNNFINALTLTLPESIWHHNKPFIVLTAIIIILGVIIKKCAHEWSLIRFWK